MSNLEAFFGLICLIQSIMLYFNSWQYERQEKRISTLKEINQLNKEQIESGNKLISDFINYKKTAGDYIESLEQQNKKNYEAAVYYRKKCLNDFEKQDNLQINTSINNS